ncbi:unnamed protein product [Timema podura]|uniref:Uncharacterized protein n=1 Tax=Timema podura TaxID=61482 RepID=A0ABN7NI90_TIMPD|nr:unnamed protein product [Timema podura]
MSCVCSVETQNIDGYLCPDTSWCIRGQCCWVTRYLYLAIIAHLSVRNIAIIALRDVDREERAIMDKFSIATYSMHHIDKLGVVNVVQEAFAWRDHPKRRNTTYRRGVQYWASISIRHDGGESQTWEYSRFTTHIRSCETFTPSCVWSSTQRRSSQ